MLLHLLKLLLLRSFCYSVSCSLMRKLCSAHVEPHEEPATKGSLPSSLLAIRAPLRRPGRLRDELGGAPRRPGGRDLHSSGAPDPPPPARRLGMKDSWEVGNQGSRVGSGREGIRRAEIKVRSKGARVGEHAPPRIRQTRRPAWKSDHRCSMCCSQTNKTHGFPCGTRDSATLPTLTVQCRCFGKEKRAAKPKDPDWDWEGKSK